MGASVDQYANRVPRRTGVGNLFVWLVLEIMIVVFVLALLSRSVIGIGVACLVAVIGLALVIPIRGYTVFGWLALRISYTTRQRKKATNVDVPPGLMPLAEWVPSLTVMRTLTGRGGEVGVITDGTAWVSVLALKADEHLIADSGEEIDLDSLASLTVQDDVALAGVQLVTYTVPAPTSILLGNQSAAAASYREILGKTKPPPTIRRSWLCVRLDPRICIGAVARRGVGTEGINATLRFGLHRAQSMLKRQGIETRALDPVEIHEVLALTSGAGPEDATERTGEGWSTWLCDGLAHRGQLVTDWGENASRGYARLLHALSDAPVLFAVTSFTMSQEKRASGAIRLVGPTKESVDDAATHLSAALGDIVMQSPAGQQVPTVLATVPFGRGLN